ncbi:MAG: hypothetical protein ACYC9O_18835 [Candidatus Latescibacterota bacterium]
MIRDTLGKERERLFSRNRMAFVPCPGGNRSTVFPPQSGRFGMPYQQTNISDILNLGHFEREARRRLGAGFIIAANALLLLTALWHSDLRRTPLILDEPYRRMRVDIIEIPSSGGVPGAGEPVFSIPSIPASGGVPGAGESVISIPSIPESRLPVFKCPAVDLRSFICDLDKRAHDFSAEIERQMRVLTNQFARDIALGGNLPDPAFPKLAADSAGTARQAGNRLDLSGEGLNLADIDSLGISAGSSSRTRTTAVR